jgi:hypothetical protein
MSSPHKVSTTEGTVLQRGRDAFLYVLCGYVLRNFAGAVYNPSFAAIADNPSL